MRNFSLAAVVVAAGTLLLASSTQVRIVRISAMKGVTVISRQPSPGLQRRWSQALLNQPVVAGDSLHTRSTSAAEVQFECGSAVRLAPDSTVMFTTLARDAKGVPVTRILVRAGRVFFSMRSEDTHDFQVEMPDGAMTSADGNAQFTVAVGAGPGAGQVRVVVRDGKAEFQTHGNGYELKSSDQISWSSPQSPVLRTRAAKADDVWARWSQSRDDLFSRALIQTRLSQFAGADMSSQPGSTALTTGAPQAMWNNTGFMAPPATYYTEDGSWNAVRDLPTSLSAVAPVPACGR